MNESGLSLSTCSLVLDEALLRVRGVVTLPKATGSALESFRECLPPLQPGRKTIDGCQRSLWDSLDIHDMTLLADPSSTNLVSRLMTGPVLRGFHQAFGHRQQDVTVGNEFLQEQMTLPFKSYSDVSLAFYIKACEALIGSSLVAASIAILSLVSSPAARIGTIWLCILLFSLAVAFFAGARPTDNFAIMAAFAACLVVFVPPPNPPCPAKAI